MFDEEEPEQQGVAYAPPIPNSPEAAKYLEQTAMSQVYLYRLNNTDLVDELEHKLRGEVMNNKGKWIKKYDSWANENGISILIGIISAVGLNKNITLGNLTHEEIYNRCRMTWQKLAYMLCINYHIYGIKKGNRDMLIQLLIQPLHSALSRSEMGREAKQLSTQTQHIEQHHSVDQPRGGFGGLIGGLRKEKY